MQRNPGLRAQLAFHNAELKACIFATRLPGDSNVPNLSNVTVGCANLKDVVSGKLFDAGWSLHNSAYTEVPVPGQGVEAITDCNSEQAAFGLLYSITGLLGVSAMYLTCPLGDSSMTNSEIPSFAGVQECTEQEMEIS